MNVTKWSRYKNLYTPLTHYCNIEGTNYNVKVIKMSKKINGVNLYSIIVSDGYDNNSLQGVYKSLNGSKNIAIDALIKFYNNYKS